MLQQVRASYLSGVSYSDHLFGELMKELDSTALAENTAVFVWSDHGDYAGDYGLVEKWPSGMEDVLTRVPLIARVPGVTNTSQGVKRDEPTQLLDVMKTVLNLANVQE